MAFIGLLADVTRQYPVLDHPLRLENRIMLFDKSVKRGPLRVMALVLKRALVQTGPFQSTIAT